MRIRMIVLAALMCVMGSASRAQNYPAPRIVRLKAVDGTSLTATFFAATKSGPGVLLLHQNTRTRDSWESVAQKLAAAGINTLTLDLRGFGDSGTRLAKLTDAERDKQRSGWPMDVDAAVQFLASQPGVDHNVIGVGGAGWLGVLNSVDAARHHPETIKSLVLMSGETFREGLQFLHQASQLPELFVFADDDEYPPTQDAMKLLYATSSSSSKQLVHYSDSENAPWRWYETADAESSGKVHAHGGHGTDMFQLHPELPGIIVHWFVTTLIKSPGHAPADGLAAEKILNQLQLPGGVAEVTEKLMEARRKDPEAQLWPEVAGDIIGGDYQHSGDINDAIEVFRLNLLAYPSSADAHSNLANAYLANGQKDLARQYAEKALTLIDSHEAPLSSWSDTEERRQTVRRDVEKVLQQTGGATALAPVRAPGTVFRDCSDCPEMVVIRAGHFVMGSSEVQRAWAATHGASRGSVADEAPQHEVTIQPFALGKYPVTRGEYATFVRKTGHSAADGCGVNSFKWDTDSSLNWQAPGFPQSDRDPVVCVSWEDAKAYVDWLNRKAEKAAPDGVYRLSSEAEWEYAARAGTSTKFWWGDDDSQASTYAWYKDNSGGRTHPVGQKPANAFGLDDMAGNVWEWTEDCYAESYASAPTDGRANESGVIDPRPSGTKKCMRVDRGGAWLYPAWLVRSATRERNPSNFRDRIMGFRVAKSLP